MRELLKEQFGAQKTSEQECPQCGADHTLSQCPHWKLATEQEGLLEPQKPVVTGAGLMAAALYDQSVRAKAEMLIAERKAKDAREAQAANLNSGLFAETLTPEQVQEFLLRQDSRHDKQLLAANCSPAEQASAPVQKIAVCASYGGWILPEGAIVALALSGCAEAGAILAKGAGYGWFYADTIPRDHPALIALIEAGKLKDTEKSRIRVVEIPADVDWVLMEAEGKEWIAEKHRTWEPKA